MKHKILIPLAFCLLPFAAFSQLSIKIEIDGLRNSSGQIHLVLSNEKELQVVGISKSITNNTCVIIIENLKPGKYAYKFFHDENKNEKIDVNWLGIPREGFGFSNNPSMSFGPPLFDKTIFELKESIVVKCNPKYF